MRTRNRRSKRIMAAALTALFLSHQTMLLSVAASEISGVNGNNGVYNIDPTAQIPGTGIGYRWYEKFNLSEGDIANLIYKYGANNIETFINLVDNQININGIINTMRDNKFYNGKAVFISPNGMIVGASGVLNVGSLGVYTPSDTKYENYKMNPTADLSTLGEYNKGGKVEINGKVFAANDVTINAGQVDINKGAGVFAGIKEDKMAQITGKNQAETLFNQLVNTDNLNTANTFYSNNGNITIVAEQGYNGPQGINIAGTVKNFGKGDTTIQNLGANGITISGEVSNANGKLYINNDWGDLNITKTGKVRNNGNTVISNTPTTGTVKITDNHQTYTYTIDRNSGLNIAGTIETTGDLEVYNNGAKGMNISGNINHNGNMLLHNGVPEYGDSANIAQNKDTGALNISGNINNTGNTTINNYAKGGLNVTKDGTITNDGKLSMLNTGAGGLTIAGNVTTKDAEVRNEAGALTVDDDSIFKYLNEAEFVNSGEGGLIVNGKITSDNNNTNAHKLEMINTKGNFDINGTVSNYSGSVDLINSGSGFNINGEVINDNSANNEYGGETRITNNSGILKVDGNVNTNNAELSMTNNGESFTINGIVNGTNNNVNLYNVNGALDINSTGRVNSSDDIFIHNRGKGGTNVKGLVNAGKNVSIINDDSNVVIGDNTENDNYITAGNDIKIVVVDGSILNYGVEKVLLNAGGNLTMDVTNGTIGSPVQQGACTGSGCTGVGPKNDGSRDFTKSINAKIKGKVNAETRNTKDVTKPEDLVINYAAIDSDMNIDHIKADGRVILTVDDDYGYNNNGKRYNMVNASSDPTKANIEGWGISLISNGSIGSKDNKVTFNQTKAPEYAMDVLTNEDIYMKALDDKYTENKVCNMISREGNIDVEFSGNTYIENLTAEKDIKIVTRGKNLTVNNLGHVVDPSVTPADYFGERNQGQKDGGYMGEDYRDETLPDHVVLKALDINKNIRPDGTLVDGGYYGMADSTVRVNNAVLDNGTLDITADNIYANGVYVHFGQNGYKKEADPSTGKVVGASEIPTGHAVRPEDVTDEGYDEHDRNYYYHDGDGDFSDGSTDVDDDDGTVDATPLEIEDDTDSDNDADNDDDDDYGKQTYIQRKILDNSVDSIDKRQFMRYRVADNKNPVAIERANGVEGLLDVSRGGISVVHNNELAVGDVIPVHIAYGGLDIKADVKVVTASTNRAGAMFVNLDQATANQLLYLNMILDDVNNISSR